VYAWPGEENLQGLLLGRTPLGFRFQVAVGLALPHAVLFLSPLLPCCSAGHGGVVKVGDFGMSRYSTAQWRTQEPDGALERTLTPGAQAGCPGVPALASLEFAGWAAVFLLLLLCFK
jgi:hypothetical protein